MKTRISSKIIDATNKVIDVTEKVHTQTSRTGIAAERVVRLLQSGVDSEVIALQLTKNSKNGTTYTKEGVEAIANLHSDCATTTAITAAQTKALIQSQSESDEYEDDKLVVPI